MTQLIVGTKGVCFYVQISGLVIDFYIWEFGFLLMDLDHGCLGMISFFFFLRIQFGKLQLEFAHEFHQLMHDYSTLICAAKNY